MTYHNVTTDELTMVRDYCLLVIALTIVDNNRDTIKYMPRLQLKDLHLAAAEALSKLMHTDLVRIKKELQIANIKIVELSERQYDALHYRLFVRGYEVPFSLIRDLVRAEISIVLGKYVKDLTDKMRRPT